MATYKIHDIIVKTENASHTWEEAQDWNGNNNISRATGDQWTHETLYQSRRGRYWIEHTSQWQGALPYATEISARAAAKWIMLMDYALPADLADLAAEIAE